MPASTATTGEGPEHLAADQRSSNRLTFRQFERIAPYHGGPLPPDDAFVAVTFFDISQGGFSYLADVPPECEELIVAMQVHDQVIYVRAQIINSRQRDDKFVVGCKFGERFTVREN